MLPLGLRESHQTACPPLPAPRLSALGNGEASSVPLGRNCCQEPRGDSELWGAVLGGLLHHPPGAFPSGGTVARARGLIWASGQLGGPSREGGQCRRRGIGPGLCPSQTRIPHREGGDSSHLGCSPAGPPTGPGAPAAPPRVPGPSQEPVLRKGGPSCREGGPPWCLWGAGGTGPRLSSPQTQGWGLGPVLT